MFLCSTIGKKVIVAVTGLILFGFVVGHLLGNLQIFAGPEKINAYAHFLRNNFPLLWGTRLILLVSVILHMATTIQLTRHNRQSRPLPYHQKQAMGATLAARTMIWSGLFLAFYIVYHLLHLTRGSVHPQFDPKNVYANMIYGFSVKPVAAIYIVGMICLGFHLYHGVWSVFQTLGLNHPKYNEWRRLFAAGSAVAITLGYISIPVAVMLGLLQ